MKTDILTKTEKIILDYNKGDILIEDAIIQLEEIRNSCDKVIDCIKNFKQENYIEFDRLSKEYKEGYNGYIFEVRQGRKTFDFSGVKKWTEINKSKKELENDLKAIFNAKIKGAIHADVSEDGEIIELPSISYGKPSVIINKNKNK